MGWGEAENRLCPWEMEGWLGLEFHHWAACLRAPGHCVPTCGTLMAEAGTGPLKEGSSSIAKVGEQPALTPSRPKGVLRVGSASLTYLRAGVTTPLHNPSAVPKNLCKIKRTLTPQMGRLLPSSSTAWCHLSKTFIQQMLTGHLLCAKPCADKNKD